MGHHTHAAYRPLERIAENDDGATLVIKEKRPNVAHGVRRRPLGHNELRMVNEALQYRKTNFTLKTLKIPQ